MNWLNCIQIYKDGKILEDVIQANPRRDSMFLAFKTYCAVIRHKPQFSVWYDTETDECIGMDTNWENYTSKKSCFISNKSRFKKDNRWNSNYVLNFIS